MNLKSKIRVPMLQASLAVLLMGGAVMNSQASLITYTDFADLSDFTLNGSAASISNPAPGNVLRLTDGLSQSGSAFLTDSVSLASDASFSTTFQFQITDPIGLSDLDGQGADGFAFLVQTVSSNVGGSGGGIGYAGINNSVAIEFDTWNNGGWDDYNGNHVGININGNINSVVQSNVNTSNPGRLNNGAEWTAWIDYDGLSDLLEVRLSTDGLRPANLLLSYTVDLTSVLGSTDAFIGFTSGTGAAGGDHDILNWEFENTFAPIGVPEPSTYLLFAAGLIFLRRRYKV